MHDRLRVPTLDTAPSVRREPVEHTHAHAPDALAARCAPLPHHHLPSAFIGVAERPAQPAVARGLPIDGARFALDALREQLEELLSVLVLARGEER